PRASAALVVACVRARRRSLDSILRHGSRARAGALRPPPWDRGLAVRVLRHRSGARERDLVPLSDAATGRLDDLLGVRLRPGRPALAALAAAARGRDLGGPRPLPAWPRPRQPP